MTDSPSTPRQALHQPLLPSPSASIPDRPIEHVEDSPAIASRQQKKVLTAREVQADPILAALAKQQQGLPKQPPKSDLTPAFKARPAPKASLADGAEPRMTKAAALRLGLPWEDKRPRKSAAAATVPADIPGHKRSSLSLNIKSLAAPAVAPRPTRASQLRTGGPLASAPTAGKPTTPIAKKDPAAVLAQMKAKAQAEQLKRRASIAVPSSLGAPQIIPRGNRSSMLRAGGQMPPPTSFRSQSALAHTTIDNVRPPSAGPTSTEAYTKKLTRRASVAGTVKSLAAPTIQPRLNKAAMLRNPGPSSTGSGTAAVSSSSTAPQRPTPTSVPSSIPFKPSGAATAPATAGISLAKTQPAIQPKPTKASLLRAGLGAKVQAK
ncbi:hypothetical protein DB88DRAFT_513014 [Papiliotrema laurentii]|uniref:Uncharacterized protein n=1 Tax=Papiliotrema laurentii TaxID=5418 RepID=A0AAD9CW62_PAPLA|nr:hypothetical protein DB88DRAFT_513014 [Papiliotrema laurentii]